MLTEEQGIKAIQALQKVMGIDEPYDTAKRNWRTMSVRDKENTAKMHTMVCGGFADAPQARIQ